MLRVMKVKVARARQPKTIDMRTSSYENGKDSQVSKESAALNGSEDEVKKTATRWKKPKWGRAGGGPKLQVKAIISHKVAQGEKKSRKYKVTLMDDTKMWISGQLAIAHCPDLIHQYREDLKNNVKVEAILAHKKQAGRSIKYLIKWKDHAKGETWEAASKASDVCPSLLKAYIEKVDEEDAKAYAVAAITEHKTFHGKSKYLVKWKDKSKGETWETPKRLVALCPELLDKFLLKHPDCLPRMHVPLNKRNSIRYKKIEPADDESDASAEEYEVERIVDVRFTKDNTREFLIRWKGYRSAYDTWQREGDLNCPDLIKRFMPIQVSPKKAANKNRTKKLPDKVDGTRSSNRNGGKQRPKYVADDDDDDDDDDHEGDDD